MLRISGPGHGDTWEVVASVTMDHTGVLVLVHDHAELPVHTWNQEPWTWDRGDLCPRYTDCQQLRDETRPDSCISTSVPYTSGAIHYTILVLYYTTTISSTRCMTMYAIPVVWSGRSRATTLHVTVRPRPLILSHRDLTLHYLTTSIR